MDNFTQRFRLPDPIKFLELPTSEAAKKFNEMVIGIGDQFRPEEVLAFALDEGVHQIVQTSSVASQKEVHLSTLMLKEPAKYLQLPMSCILDPENVNQTREKELTLLEFSFSRASEKAETLRKCSEEISDLIKTKKIVTDVCLVVDELFTNALFNAPFNQKQAGVKTVERAGTLDFTVDKKATIRVGVDEDRVAVVCIDQYGTLNLQDLLKRIRACYERGVGAMLNWGPGGAGVGSYMIFHNSLGYYVGIQPGKKAVVSCTLPRRANQFGSKRTKNLHFFETSP